MSKRPFLTLADLINTKQVVIINDCQKDLVAKGYLLDKYGRNFSDIDKMLEKIEALLPKVRSLNIPIQFHQFIYDPELMAGRAAEKFKKGYELPYCKKGSKG